MWTCAQTSTRDMQGMPDATHIPTIPQKGWTSRTTAQRAPTLRHRSHLPDCAVEASALGGGWRLRYAPAQPNILRSRWHWLPHCASCALHSARQPQRQHQDQPLPSTATMATSALVTARHTPTLPTTTAIPPSLTTTETTSSQPRRHQQTISALLHSTQSIPQRKRQPIHLLH